jgi:hypothetical protein
MFLSGIQARAEMDARLKHSAVPSVFVYRVNAMVSVPVGINRSEQKLWTFSPGLNNKGSIGKLKTKRRLRHGSI